MISYVPDCYKQRGKYITIDPELPNMRPNYDVVSIQLVTAYSNKVDGKEKAFMREMCRGTRAKYAEKNPEEKRSYWLAIRGFTDSPNYLWVKIMLHPT